MFTCYFIFYSLSFYFKNISPIDNIRIYLYELQKQPIEELVFCSISQQLQMDFTFSDNVSILCLSRNVTKSKIKGAETGVILIIFFIMSSQTSTLILFAFFTVALHESGTRKAISWVVTIYNKTVMQFYFSNRTSAG